MTSHHTPSPSATHSTHSTHSTLTDADISAAFASRRDLHKSTVRADPRMAYLMEQYTSVLATYWQKYADEFGCDWRTMQANDPETYATLRGYSEAARLRLKEMGDALSVGTD